MRLPSRGSDDSDVIRARLRALLDERRTSDGWLPGDDLDGWPPEEHSPEPAWEPDDGVETAAPVGRHRVPERTARWNPGRRGARALWAAGLVAALLLIVWTWLDRPTVEPAPVSPTRSTPTTAAVPSTPTVGEVADTATMVVVSVVGLVARPGLVTLPSGSRVAAAVEGAGGLLPGADPASVNLAAVVSDGQQIAVGVPSAGGAGPAGDGAAPTAGGGMVDLNTAGVAELDGLPGIGPVLAQRIVDHRTREGPFTSVDQLDDVPGIGPSIASELAELVTV